MSEQPNDMTASKSKTEPSKTDPATAPANKQVLSDLMASGDVAATKAAAKNASSKAAPDLDAEALRAAEHALAEGQKALAAARAHMATADASPAKHPRRRELWLRVLLAINIVAMIVVASLPAPSPNHAPPSATHDPTKDHGPGQPQFNDPWNRALAAAESRDFGKAVEILDQYLASSPRMAASQQLSVLMALAHYSARRNDFKQAQEYQRRADAIDKSHSLPEDLIATAKAAADSGDQEQLRRIWARFLLQQRQVPSWLYKHVAEAYLQLGDSYRLQANAAAEAARRQQLEETAKALREQEKANEEHK